MSQIEYHKGLIREVQLNGKTIHEWAEEEYTKRYKSKCENVVEWIAEELFDTHIITNDRLFEIVECEELEVFELFEILDNGDISFVVSTHTAIDSVEDNIKDLLIKNIDQCNQ